MRELLQETAERATRYLETLDDRAVYPSEEAVARLAALGGALPAGPGDPAETLRLLDDIASPATVATAGPRYFGFVTGGALPATVAANWMAAAWDQCPGLTVLSPACAAVEQVALDWLVELLVLPEGCGAGFVTGATAANFTALAAARHALLERAGWDVERRGLYGAPEITVVVGEEVHVSVLKALSLLGLGRERVVRVEADATGALRSDRLPELTPLTIVCTQAGNVNSGAFDPVGEVCQRARAAGAWVHVDGAFGLWVLADPRRREQARGAAQADSWAVDAHKWLNVPYDSGIAFCRDPQAMRAAMSTSAAYLVDDAAREPHHFTPEMSRRARGVEVWAALRSLGRSGVADLVDRTCRLARRFADRLSAAGHQILNEVNINQVLVSFGDDDTTRRVVAESQREGTMWAGGTTWKGRAAMRISVSSWATTEADVDRSVEALVRVAAAAGSASR